MTNKVQNRLVEKFLSEISGYLQDLGEEIREDILSEVRENLEARAQDEPADFQLPDAMDYANDLRVAAGLQPVATNKSRTLGELVSSIRSKLSNNPILRKTGCLLRPFKPLFWIAIGISSYAFLDFYVLGDEGYIGVPTGLEQWLVWSLMILGSLWFGSANFGPLFSQARAIAVAISFIPMAVMFHGLAENAVQLSDKLANGNPASRTTGLLYNGLPVTNIFPYDAKGNLLENVRLVDDQGRPLNSAAQNLVTPVYGTDLDGNPEIIGYLRPSQGRAGEVVWNVYPLKAAFSPVGFGTNSVQPQD